MTDKPFDESLGDLEYLLDSKRLLHIGSFDTLHDCFWHVEELIGNAIIEMVKTIGYQKSRYSTQCLHRLTIARTKFLSHTDYMTQGLDLLIRKIISALHIIGNANAGRALAYGWTASITSCKLVIYLPEGIRSVPGHWAEKGYRLPLMFEYEAESKAFHVFSGNKSLYRTPGPQELPIVLTWNDSLKVRIVLLSLQKDQHNMFFDVVVANLRYRDEIVRHLASMGCSVFPQAMQRLMKEDKRIEEILWDPSLGADG